MSRLGTLSTAVACIWLGGACAAPADEQQPPDPARLSFVDNLLAKEEAGEWTRGVGLAATLRLFVGEAEEEDVLRHGDVEEREGTGLLEMAYDYLEDGPDETVKAEIRSLMGFLVFLPDQLERMAGLRPDASATFPAVASAAGLAPSVLAASVLEECSKLYGTGKPVVVGDCLNVLSFTIGTRLYRLFQPLGVDIWSDPDYLLVKSAVEKSVPEFDTLGAIHSADIVFSPNAAAKATTLASARSTPDHCTITFFPASLALSGAQFQQTVAHELAHCFQHATYVVQRQAKQEDRKWYWEGHAEWLSNIVYPDVDYEHRWLPTLRKRELHTSLLDRHYDNHLFFQHLENTIGRSGIDALIRSFPGKGATREGFEAALSAFPNIADIYHDYARSMSLLNQIDDTSKHKVKFEGVFDPIVVWREGQPFFENSVNPFETRRYVITTLDELMLAQIELEVRGDHHHSVREIPDGEWEKGITWFSIPKVVDDEEQCENYPMQLVVTHTATDRSPEWELSVPLVAEAGPSIIGRWRLDNSSYAESLAFIFPQQILESYSGTVTAEFHRDGTVDVRYDGFSVSGRSNVRNPSIGTDLRTSLTTVTDASGTTTWRPIVEGSDYLVFGNDFEDYLTGSRVWDDKRQGPVLDFGGMYRIGINPIDVDQMDDPFDLSQSLDEYHNVFTTTENLGWGIFGNTHVVTECDGAIMHFTGATGDAIRATFYRESAPEHDHRRPRSRGNER